MLQNEQAVPDIWLAIWSARQDLSPPQRRHVDEERERRKALRARESLVVAWVRGQEGMTPVQRHAMTEALAVGCEVEVVSVVAGRSEDHMKDVIQRAGLVLAAPREMIAPTNVPAWDRSPVWAAVAYAKHRRTAVKVIMPDGREA